MALRLSANQQTFARTLARLTGLNTRTIQGWIINEEPQGAAATAHRNDQNWLNVGITDSGPLGFTHQSSWQDPTTAAQNTAAFLKGQKFGASQGIQNILKTTGQDVGAQVRAIQQSGWASGGETALAQLVAQAQGLHNIGAAPAPTPKASPRASAAAAPSTPPPPAAPTTRQVQTSSTVAPDQSLQGVISQLAAAQQQAPAAQRPASGGFDPGYSRYLSADPTGPLATSSTPSPSPSPITPTTGTGSPANMTAQIAALSSLVGPSTFTDTKTVTTPAATTAKTTTAPTGTGITPTGQPTPTPVKTKTAVTPPAKVTPAVTQQAGAARATAFARAHIGAYAENLGSNRGTQLDALESLSGMSGLPWCAMFATTTVVHGGAPKSARTASVWQLTQWAKAGTNGYEKGVLPAAAARAGDLIMRGNDHVGFVAGRTADGRIIVIEGNANGSGGVVQRIYQPGQWTGVARPKYQR